MTADPNLTTRIREALAKATPGPWYVDGPEFGGMWVVTGAEAPADSFAVHPSPEHGPYGVLAGYGAADAALIVLLRNNIEALLAENDRLRAVAEAARGIADEVDYWDTEDAAAYFVHTEPDTLAWKAFHAALAALDAAND